MVNQRDQLITGVLAVGLTAAFAGLFYVPQQKKVAHLRAEADRLRVQVAQRSQQAANVEDLEQQVQRAEAELAGFEAEVPSEAQLGPFVEQITDLAARQSVVDPVIEPMTALLGPGVTVFPIHMSFTGEFGSVYGFLDAIEAQPRLARVSQFELRRVGEQRERLEAHATVEIYYRGQQEERGVGG